MSLKQANKSLSICDSGAIDQATFGQNLHAFKARVALDIGVAVDANITAFADRIAEKICRTIAIHDGSGASAPEIRRQIRISTTIGGVELIGPGVLNGWTLEKLVFHKEDKVFWSGKILGEIRSVVAGIRTNEETKEVLESLLNAASCSLDGISGYVSVATLMCQGNMEKAHKSMANLCKERNVPFSRLHWGPTFKGTTTEFFRLRNVLRKELAAEGSSTFQGIEGYVAFADAYVAGNMERTSVLASAVCKADGLRFSELGWGSQLKLSTRNYRRLRNALEAELKGPQTRAWQGVDGYIAFAEAHRAGNMSKAYNIVSAICKANSLRFADLNWGSSFPGNTEDFAHLRKELEEQFEMRSNLYQGIEGYVCFADRYSAGDMKKAHAIASVCCKASQLDFSELNWGSNFPGNTTDFLRLCETVKHEFRDLKASAYQGTEGYVRFADKYTGGQMQKAFMTVSAICKANSLRFSELEWVASFQGKTDQFSCLCSDLTHALKDETPTKFSGIDGYVAFAEKYVAGDMQRAFMLVRAICRSCNLDYSRLEWPGIFFGSTKSFFRLRKELTASLAESKESRYLGIEGYVVFANEHATGDMQKAYTTASMLCQSEGIDFSSLDWGSAFQGSTTMFLGLRNWLANEFEKLDSSSLRGIKGYLAFADTHTSGDMQRAHRLVSVLCKAENLNFSSLEWGAIIRSTTADFAILQEVLKAEIEGDGTGSFQGIKGYLHLADRFAGGDMNRAAGLMRAVCSTSGLPGSKLNWGAAFPASTTKFQQLSLEMREVLQEGTSNIFHGVTGYVAFANIHAAGNMKRAHSMATVLCEANGLEFSVLGWDAAFHGSTKDFARLQDLFVREFRAVEASIFQGLEGYVEFSNRYARGHMQQGYMLGSALCKLKQLDFSLLNWGPCVHSDTSDMGEAHFPGRGAQRIRKQDVSLIRETADYIVKNNGPDENGYPHPARTKLPKFELEIAIEDAIARGVDSRLRPYHFQATMGMWQDSRSVDEVIIKKVDSLLESSYSGSLHKLIANVRSEELRSSLSEEISGRTVEVSLVQPMALYGSSPFNLVSRYLILKGLDQEFANLRPYHFASSKRGVSDSEIFDELLIKKMDSLLAEHHAGNVVALLTSATGKDLQEPFSEIVGGELMKVSLYSTWAHFGGNTFRMFKRYLELKGLAEEYEALQPFHLCRTSSNFYDTETIHELLVRRIDQLKEQKFSGDIIQTLIYSEYADLHAPFVDFIAGKQVSVSTHRTLDYFNEDVYETLQRYLKQKGLNDLSEEFKSYHRNRASKFVYKDPAAVKEILSLQMNHLLQSKFAGDIFRLATEIRADDLKEPIPMTLAGHSFEIGSSTLLKLFAHSPYAMVSRYLHDSGAIELATQLRSYHMAKAGNSLSTDKESRDEIVLKKVNSLLEIKYDGKLSNLLSGVTMVELGQSFNDLLTGRPVRVSPAVAFAHFSNSPYKFLERYFQLICKPFPYSPACFIGPQQTRERRISGNLSGADLRAIRSEDRLSLDTERYGYKHFSSAGKRVVREEMQKLVSEHISDRCVAYLGLETERFESVTQIFLAKIVDSTTSTIIESDERVYNAMCRIQMREDALGGVVASGMRIINERVEKALRSLDGAYNVVNLDYLGHLSPTKEQSIKLLFERNLLKKEALIFLTLQNSPLARSRAQTNGYSDDQLLASMQILEREGAQYGYTVDHLFDTTYQGGSGSGRGGEMLFVAAKAKL